MIRQTKSISICVTHPSWPDGPIQGFRYLWAFYVNGFRPDRHCQPCFNGRRDPHFYTGQVHSGRSYELDCMDRFRYVYVCGVGTGAKASLGGKNLHLPLEYAPGQAVEATTYNGYRIVAHNAAAVPIPALPDGWNGFDPETTRCKNFQFAVAYFGDVLS